MAIMSLTTPGERPWPKGTDVPAVILETSPATGSLNRAHAEIHAVIPIARDRSPISDFRHEQVPLADRLAMPDIA
jgi:hypothetical protein